MNCVCYRNCKLTQFLGWHCCTFTHKNEEFYDFEGNSLAVQWLGLGAFDAVAWGSVPGWGTKILQAVAWPKKRIL